MTYTNTSTESESEREEREATEAGKFDTESAFGAWGDILWMDEEAELANEAAYADLNDQHPRYMFERY